MSLKEKLQILQDELDLSKKFPGYFNKSIFRSVVMISLILLVIVLVNNNMSLRYTWIECEDTICTNPFRPCQEQTGKWYTPPDNCIMDPQPEWVRDLCQGQCPATLTKGQIIGEKPPFLAEHFNGIIMALVWLAFFINHLLWIKRGGRK